MNLKKSLKHIISALLQSKALAHRKSIDLQKRALEQALEQHYDGIYLWALGRGKVLEPDQLDQRLKAFVDSLSKRHDVQWDGIHSLDWWCREFARWDKQYNLNL